MLSIFHKSLGVLLLTVFTFGSFAFAAQPTGDAAFDTVDPKLIASSPNDCGTRVVEINKEKVDMEPVNCLFLLEPIGGDPGYDLYLVEPECFKQPDGTELCAYSYVLWNGGAVLPPKTGPVQAILTFEPGKAYQGPFGLLYNYLGLVYGYMSGLIVGIAVLYIVIGGVTMATSGGKEDRITAGKSRIIKALIGMILWFTASLILYTINPTFFAF